MRSEFQTLLLAATVFLLFAIHGCGDGQSGGTGPEVFSYDEPWPEDLESLYTLEIVDPAGDQVLMPPEQAGPPYASIIPFPPVDVTRIAVGVDATFLYMRVEWAGTIPSHDIQIAAEGEVEAQAVTNQGMNIALNTDGDQQTGGNGEGVHGIEVFFAIGFDYSMGHNVYANFGFPEGDLHFAQGQETGELGFGGQGHDYAVSRYKLAGMSDYFTRGITVEWGSWSEAESYTDQGELLYHHFAFDQLGGGTWAVP